MPWERRKPTMSDQQPRSQVTRRQKRIIDPSSGPPKRPARSHRGVERCRECGAVHYRARWYLKADLPREALAEGAKIKETLCEACRQVHDHNAAGVLDLTG